MLPPPGRRPTGIPPAAVALPAKGKSRRRSTALTASSAAGPMTPAERSVTPLETSEFAALEAEVGSRQKLVSLLSTAPLSAEEDVLLAALADPQNDAISLARLCALSKISRAKFYELLKTAALAQGKAKAMFKVADAIPAVAASVMTDAIPGERNCRRCHGLGQIAGPPLPDHAPNPQPCDLCYGTGKVYHEPELALRTTALKLGQLLGDKSGTTINTTINNANLNAGLVQAGTYDKLVAAMDGVLYGRGRERVSAPVVEVDAGSSDIVEGEQA